MPINLILPLVGSLLISFPGLPGIPWKAGLKALRRHPAVVDTLPPAWKPASRLALEDQFVRASLPSLVPRPIGLKTTYDPRQLRVGFDPDSGAVSATAEYGSVELGAGTRIPLAQFTHDLSRE